jgi:hypothetical protein
MAMTSRVAQVVLGVRRQTRELGSFAPRDGSSADFF